MSYAFRKAVRQHLPRTKSRKERFFSSHPFSVNKAGHMNSAPERLPKIIFQFSSSSLAQSSHFLIDIPAFISSFRAFMNALKNKITGSQGIILPFAVMTCMQGTVLGNKLSSDSSKSLHFCEKGVRRYYSFQKQRYLAFTEALAFPFFGSREQEIEKLRFQT